MAPTCQIVSAVQSIPKDELYLRLYLHHTFGEPNQNQEVIVDPSSIPNSFGVTVVNDWPMTEEPGANSKVIARAQGLHIQAGIIIPRWYNSFGIVFEDDRYVVQRLNN
jgi:Dirigent-like protein